MNKLAWTKPIVTKLPVKGVTKGGGGQGTEPFINGRVSG
jgi:hypothetical protein